MSFLPRDRFNPRQMNKFAVSNKPSRKKINRTKTTRCRQHDRTDQQSIPLVPQFDMTSQLSTASFSSPAANMLRGGCHANFSSTPRPVSAQYATRHHRPDEPPALRSKYNSHGSHGHKHMHNSKNHACRKPQRMRMCDYGCHGSERKEFVTQGMEKDGSSNTLFTLQCKNLIPLWFPGRKRSVTKRRFAILSRHLGPR